MIQLIYTSRAQEPFTEAELKKLLLGSRMRNGAVAVSGMLLHHEGSFLQMLEGEEPQVMATFNRIRGDSRHHDIRVLARNEGVAKRQFPEWSMGFADTKGSAGILKGYVRFADRLDLETLSETDAVSLLVECGSRDEACRALA